MFERSRPLSPFLHYRWQYTNTCSILHRLAGIILAAGFVILVYWVSALAQGPEAYARALKGFGHPVFKVLLMLGLVAAVYHFCNGIRHLLFDSGVGLERRQARRGAWVVGVLTILIVGIIGAVFLLGRGAP